jgi:hypothetical protein
MIHFLCFFLHYVARTPNVEAYKHLPSVNSGFSNLYELKS